ncbi:MAG: hypothetical protein WCX73_02290 [Candidatus Pacearchaeota archaeon]|jgi:hypothetical protein
MRISVIKKIEKNLKSKNNSGELEIFVNESQNPTEKVIATMVLHGEVSPTSIEYLNELAETAKQLAYNNVERVKFDQEGNKGYKLTLKFSPNGSTKEILDLLKERLTDLEKFSIFMDSMKQLSDINNLDSYLGNWVCNNLSLRGEVARDVKTVYSVLEKEIGVTPQDVYSGGKTQDISKSRAIISRILTEKYKEKLSTVDISKVLGRKNHVTAIIGCRAFENNLIQTYDNGYIERAVQRGLKTYAPPNSKKYKNIK